MPASKTKLPKALKIGLVLDDGLDSPDGVQQYVLALGEWLQSEGHSVVYLVGETEREDIRNIRSLSRNVSVSSNGNTLTIPLIASRKQLKTVLKEEQFDILHVQTPYSPMMGERLIRLAGPSTAVVGTFHILPHSKFITFGTYALGLWCRLFSLRRFDAMLSVSAVAATYAKNTFGIDSTILPNVVDYKRFKSASPLRLYSDKTLTVLFLGRLVPRKGCRLLLEAINQLERSNDKLPKYRVVVCGRGPLSNQLKSYAKDHELDQVEFAGFISEADKPSYYASADVAVFPSNGGESFGIVLLEAMASGKAAVLAGDNPGYRSVMEPKANELLFNPRSVDELAEKLKKLLNDSHKRQRLAQWGSEYTAEFDTAVVGRRLIGIYNQALRKRRQL